MTFECLYLFEKLALKSPEDEVAGYFQGVPIILYGHIYSHISIFTGEVDKVTKGILSIFSP